MKIISNVTYLNEEESARHIGVSVEELLTLMLESGRPAHIIENGEFLYDKVAVERFRSIAA